jgi:hypothetical protein
VLAACPTAVTTEVGDIDGGPPGGAVGISDSGHHRSPSGTQEMLELKVQYHPPSTLRNVDGGPREASELEIQERSACEARPLGRVVNSCRNLVTNAQRVVRIYFTLTQVGHFC